MTVLTHEAVVTTDNVCVCVCSVHCQFSGALWEMQAAPRISEKLQDRLKRWKKWRLMATV